MILDEISVYDFGVFSGRNSAILTPPDESKPITLFGGLNGNGKTTILEAIQLALYGKLATDARQNGTGYEEYLRRAINRHARPSDGAAVEIAFRSTVDGKTRHYRVCRAWSVKGDRVREKLDVFVDDQVDRVLTETWEEQVECFMPARLSSLFFFDGERIEALADPDRSAELLRTAISALLGVDLVDQLGLDLRVLDRRKQKERVAEGSRREIEQFEQHLLDLRTRRNVLVQERGGIEAAAGRARDQVARCEEKLRAAGGGLLDRQHHQEQQRAELEGKLGGVVEQLLRLAAGALPLSLAGTLLAKAIDQAQKEKNAVDAQTVVSTMDERDTQLLKELSKSKTPAPVLKMIKNFFQKDLQRRREVAKVERYLELDDDDHRAADALLGDVLVRHQDDAKQLLTEADSLDVALQAIDRKLAAIPDEDAVSDAIRELNEVQSKLASHEQRLAEIETQVGDIERESQTTTTKLERLLRAGEQAKLDNEKANRFLHHSDRVRETLDRFRTRLVASHVKRLEGLILDGYAALLRKDSLISELKIDEKTCQLAMLSNTGRSLAAERLSAGERQLLAVAMLWGLGRASGRPLPVVIDTPLGRLDTAHRNHLVTRYFPYASHQVVLLSTDEEIDQEYYQKLRSRVGNAYTLEYDESSQSSAIVPGYLWE